MNYCISMWKLPKMNVSTELKHSGGREEAYVNYVDYVEHTSLSILLGSCCGSMWKMWPTFPGNVTSIEQLVAVIEWLQSWTANINVYSLIYLVMNHFMHFESSLSTPITLNYINGNLTMSSS